ncbi:MAG: ComF family protein [Symploca sp. SIO2G7]|nr:ComF family protein [Symploca sp. SIO2G7]
MPVFDRTFAGFIYSQPTQGLIQRFKFHGDLAAGRLLSTRLAEELQHSIREWPECMLPVPLHWLRQWRRGFNQAELIARDVAHALALEYQNVLKRTRATQSQSELPARQRAGNVRGAFSLRSVDQLPSHVALVDDVMTTGTTLNECARVLKNSGVERVDVWVVARA